MIFQGIFVQELEEEFLRKHGRPLNPKVAGFQTTKDMIEAVPLVFRISRPSRGIEKVLLNSDYKHQPGNLIAS